jgi:hypothetical protein
VVATGCGSSDKNASSPADTTTATGTVAETTTAATTKTQSTPTQQELAQTYLTIVGPANIAIDTFSKKANRWTDQTTSAQAAKDAAPLIPVIDAVTNELLRVQWPAATQPDVKELARDWATVNGDLASLSSVDALSASDWARQFTSDITKASADSNIVRADLGLPPVK